MRDILSALWSVIGAKSSSCTGWMMPRVGLPNEISKTWPRIRQSLRQETDCRTCMKQAKICISLSLLYERNSKSIPLTSGIRCRILGKINPKLIGNVFWWVISKKCYKLADATLTRNWYKSDKETNFYCFKDCQCERKVTFSKQFFNTDVWYFCLNVVQGWRVSPVCPCDWWWSRLRLRYKDAPALMVCDGHPGHWSLDTLNYI